jgi:hypothetical protein
VPDKARASARRTTGGTRIVKILEELLVRGADQALIELGAHGKSVRVSDLQLITASDPRCSPCPRTAQLSLRNDRSRSTRASRHGESFIRLPSRGDDAEQGGVPCFCVFFDT